MTQYLDIIKNNPLFQDISTSELGSLLQCLNARQLSFDKKEVIVFTGNPVDFVGLVLSGNVKIMKEDIEGNDLLLTEVQVGEIFGEVFACAGILHSPVTIVASEESKILSLDYKKIITTCPRSCMFHAKVTENMLKILAYKNLMLNQKIEIIGKRSLREKILCYLRYQSNGMKQFTISLNREELASYLCADRSAVSNELSKLQKEGIIKFYKNRFELLKI